MSRSLEGRKVPCCGKGVLWACLSSSIRLDDIQSSLWETLTKTWVFIFLLALLHTLKKAYKICTVMRLLYSHCVARERTFLASWSRASQLLLPSWWAPPAIAVAVRACAGGAWEPGSAGGAAFSHHLVCSDLEKVGKYCFGGAPMCTFW